MTAMQCRDMRRLADSFLSGELQVETNHEVLQHLESCPDCRADVSSRRALRDQLRRAFDASEALRPRPDFGAEIAGRVREARGGWSRRSVLRTWWALAAGVVLTTGGGLIFRHERERSRLAALARLAAGDHQNCAISFRLAEHPIPMDEAGRRFGLPYSALTGFTPPTPDSTRVLDRHACVYEGRRFAHIVFQHEDGPASLLIVDAPPPPAPGFEPEQEELVISLPAGRFAGFLVMKSRDREAAMRLATACVAPLADRLA